MYKIRQQGKRWALYDNQRQLTAYFSREVADATLKAINRAPCPATFAAAVAHLPNFALNPRRKIRLAGIFHFCRENQAQAIRYPSQTWVTGRNGFKCLIVRSGKVYFASSHKPQKLAARGIKTHLETEYQKHLQMLKSVKV